MDSVARQVQDVAKHGQQTAQLSSVRQETAQNGKRKDELALMIALAHGETVADACRQSGVAERTAHRRLYDQVFRRDVRSLRSQMLERAVGKLVDVATEAAETCRVGLCVLSEV